MKLSHKTYDDPRHPIRHDCKDEPDATNFIIQKNVAWVAKHADHPEHYCEHGSYVGFQRALAYRCRFCPEV